MSPHEKLRGYRIDHHLTQSQAAAICHVCLRQWIRYESGKQPIPHYIWKLFVSSFYLTEKAHKYIDEIILDFTKKSA
jgi:transcriptional regulator with XRE-family HTH domain